jgi:hypothetical protein
LVTGKTLAAVESTISTTGISSAITHVCYIKLYTQQVTFKIDHGTEFLIPNWGVCLAPPGIQYGVLFCTFQ